jgi:hypothetical protein
MYIVEAQVKRASEEDFDVKGKRKRRVRVSARVCRER